jgi:hypothetical protein
MTFIVLHRAPAVKRAQMARNLCPEARLKKATQEVPMPKTIAQRISALEKLVAGFFSGATRTSKARVKRAAKRSKRAAGTVAKRATQTERKAKRAVKRAVKTARRRASV